MVHMHIGGNMATDSKSKKTKWDGKSRVSNDLYRKNFDKIFKKKSHPKKDWFKYMECASTTIKENNDK